MSLGFGDSGCDNANAVDCAVLTLDGVAFKPFAEITSDGGQRGLALMTLDVATCSVVGSLFIYLFSIYIYIYICKCNGK